MAVAAYATDYGSLAFIIGLTTLAGLLGSLLLYGIMRGGGRKLVERYPRLFMMPRKRRERLEKTFERASGQSLVFFLRLVPLTRVLVNIPAGLAKMKVIRFTLLTAAGLLLYHTGFLWFAYEVRRPGSALATQRQQFQDAYGSPAMDFVAANAIVSGLVLVVIGAIASVRASRSMLRDPEESTGSLLGWLATMVLLLGGMAVGFAVYVDPAPVVALADLGGVDVEALGRSLHLTATQVLVIAAALMVAIGLVLRVFTSHAHGHRRRHAAEKKKQDPDHRRKMLRDPFAKRGPDDGMEDLVSFEGTTAAPPAGRRP
jgi:membrane protein DedA with SNARE-associated domain